MSPFRRMLAAQKLDLAVDANDEYDPGFLRHEFQSKADARAESPLPTEYEDFARKLSECSDEAEIANIGRSLFTAGGEKLMLYVSYRAAGFHRNWENRRRACLIRVERAWDGIGRWRS